MLELGTIREDVARAALGGGDFARKEEEDDDRDSDEREG
jgi:hypothetical protein